MTTPTKAPGVRQFFSRHGTLSKWHPNYEFRPGQLEMAEAVESALADRKHLIVEAGTGTGKTLAYLVPAHSLRQAHRRLHRHQESAGAALLQGHSFPAEAFPPAAAGLLHEGPQQLRLPPEDLRRRAASRFSPAWKRSPISRSSATGRRPPNPATAPRSRRCPKPAPPGPKSMPAAICAPARSASSSSAASSP